MALVPSVQSMNNKTTNRALLARCGNLAAAPKEEKKNPMNNSCKTKVQPSILLGF